MQFARSSVLLLLARWPLLTGFALFSVLGGLVFLLRGHNPGQHGAQPIAFNHAKHVAAGMACTDCHTGAESQARATVPALSACLMCHQAPLTESPEEKKLLALAAEGKELAWKPLPHMPAHVFFTHRRHVQQGGLECATCHGPMDKTTAPPQKLLVPLTMDGCIECHEKSGARTDCNDCHL